MAQVATDPTVWLAQGQCVEQYGTGEAYLPILEAFGQLCLPPQGGQRLVALLRQQAPTWLGQMPWRSARATRRCWSLPIACWGRRCSGWGSLALPAPIWSRALPSTTHSSTVLMACATAMRPAPVAWASWPVSCGTWATRIRRYSGAVRRWALAEELGHPFSLAFTLRQTVGLHLLCREAHEVLTRTQRLLTPATEHGFAQMVASGTHDRGWALAMQGHVAEGIALIRQGHAAFRATGGERASLLALLAEALGKAGAAEEGLRVLTEGLALVEQHGERVHEAELCRLKGELLLALSGDHDIDAHACFQKALHVARQQQAKALELRAADEPWSIVATAGQAGRSPPAPGRGIWLVHRGL